MLTLLIAAILAGSVITFTEFVFILLTCGPFWFQPSVLLQTWLIYSTGIFIGLSVLLVLSRLIPPLDRILGEGCRRFRLYFILSWLLSNVFLTALVIKDLDSGNGYWKLVIIALLVGVVAILLLKFTIKTEASIFSRGIILSIGYIALTLVVFLISDKWYTNRIEQRTAAFNGSIPHMCLIVLDTTRGDHLSCNGYPFLTTPNIDKIAAQGINCSHAYSSTNWTPPGHISIFTGKYPSQHGNGGQPFMPHELSSLTEILNDQGYFCVGMYSNPLAGRNINLMQGFDVDMAVHTADWVQPLWKKLQDSFIYKDHGSRSTFHMALETFKWVQNRGGHLFIYLNLLEPHANYEIHQPFFSDFVK